MPSACLPCNSCSRTNLTVVTATFGSAFHLKHLYISLSFYLIPICSALLSDLRSELFCANKCTSALLQPQLTILPSNEVKQRKKTCGKGSKGKWQLHDITQQGRKYSQLTKLFQGQNQTDSFPPYFLNCNMPYFLPYICNAAKHLETQLASRIYKKEKQLCYTMLKGTVFLLKWIWK